jgi:hypothetical protein
MVIPIVVVLSIPPLLATLAGYLMKALWIEYVALAAMALVSLGIYALFLNFHARMLAQREIEILEAVREPIDE